MTWIGWLCPYLQSANPPRRECPTAENDNGLKVFGISSYMAPNCRIVHVTYSHLYYPVVKRSKVFSIWVKSSTPLVLYATNAIIYSPTDPIAHRRIVQNPRGILVKIQGV